MGAEELQVDEEKIHLRVSDALADAERRGVDTVHALLDRRQAVGEPEPPVPVPVPVDLHVLAGLAHELPDKPHELPHAVRRRMAHGVGEADAPGAALDRRGVQLAERLGAGARRILGHVHDVQSLGHRERHRLLGRPTHHARRPALRVAADRRAADEGPDLQAEAGRLRDLGDRRDVGLHRSRCTVRGYRQVVVDDLPGDPQHRLARTRSGAGQADVRRLDAQLHHQVEQLTLLGERRIPHGRILQPIPKRLVVQLDVQLRVVEAAGKAVPIVDEIL